MLSTLKLRYYQGKQFIAEPENAVLKDKFRGIPVLEEAKCNQCDKCISVCQAKAIKSNPLEIDLGKCVFCGDCQRACDRGAIKYTSAHKLGTTQRESLIISSKVSPEDFVKDAVRVKEDIIKMFGRSLKLRQVSAGGCNGCEMELNACSNANFDMGRYGIDFVASPRHADGIVITGVVNKNMAEALDDTVKSVPEPKIIILAGSCAISGGVFQDSKELNRDILLKYKIDLYIPGCPVHPLTFIDAIRRYVTGT